MALDDVAVPADADTAPPLDLQGGGIVRLSEEAPDILPRLPQGAVCEHQKLDHMAGVIVVALHRQQIVACDGQVDRLHRFPLSLIDKTAQPYRAISRALVIRLNTSVSVTSRLARSLSVTPVASV